MTKKKPNIPITVTVVALALFFIDAFVLNQGVIALITLIIGLPILLIRTLVSYKDKALRKKRFIVVGIFSIMVFLILTSNGINNKIAEKRAELIIVACEEYKDKYGAFPSSLSALVPEFLDKIPRAKYTFSFNSYRYLTPEDKHEIMYVTLPPFGRRYYELENKRWGYID